nr:uncharacterized protein LOC109173786 [Ipomoea batatas]
MERSAGRTGSKLAIALLLPLLNMSRRWGGLTLPLESLAGRPPAESIVVAAGYRREPPPSHTAAKVRRCYVAENGTRHTAEAHRRAAPPPLNQSASSRREEEREGRHQASAALLSKAAAATAPTRCRRWREAPEEQGRSSPLLCFCRCSTCQGDGEASRCRWSRSLEGHRLSRSSLLLATGDAAMKVSFEFYDYRIFRTSEEYAQVKLQASRYDLDRKGFPIPATPPSPLPPGQDQPRLEERRLLPVWGSSTRVINSYRPATSHCPDNQPRLRRGGYLEVEEEDHPTALLEKICTATPPHELMHSWSTNQMSLAVVDLFVLAKESEDMQQKEVAPLKKALHRKEAKLKDMELQMQAIEQAVKATNLRANNVELQLKTPIAGYHATPNFLSDAAADLVRLAGHLCKDLKPVEAFFQAFLKA